MRYADRRQAGRMIAKVLLDRHYGCLMIVQALPRGGVPVAYEVAKALEAPLDVLVVRKLGCPGDPEVALGALAPGNIVVENTDVMRLISHPQQALNAALASQRVELARRERACRGDMPAARVAGRAAILVDDGAATGATMLAAVRSLRLRAVAKIIVALPVAASDAVDRLRKEADEIICLQISDTFGAVGSWYEQFPQVEDEEVIELLAKVPARCQSAPLTSE